ncbi:glycerol-3-phosphate acyltransferase/fatty acid synthesis protein PlsX [Anaplasma centrale str. Israel]|uniref:Phosphate acyltransferase n=1 Tax=Anaplasma centrale (strain Israel) TaxID=574556 RepID=D1AU67_ANACI|nr:phosphate acyltransferase PlsX [Anaplasma centrale]ACZ49095.1 glycerol-3-phosphate acyltransferase/fatty acid synthesis protein PlsX [Anaplasma centrale str. Israel]
MVHDGGASVSVALDAMGGDCGPEVAIKGADLVLSGVVPCECKVHLSIYGKESAVLPVLSRHRLVEKNSVFIDTPDAVLPDDRPSFALRHRRKSSMWCAIEGVKKGMVASAVSAGNTGALMAISRYLLGTLQGIDRPAIATVLPSREGNFVVLDLGANAECVPDSLFQFAIMGRAFSKTVLGVKNPKVGLLNIGAEETKGTCGIKEAFALMRDAKQGINFYGYIEAKEAFDGVVDVVVTDGFSGNVMLKTCEAVAGLTLHILKKEICSSLFGRALMRVARPFYFRKRASGSALDVRSYNGAVLLGLNGVVVKSHGSADAVAFAHAIKEAVCAISQGAMVKEMISEVSNI